MTSCNRFRNTSATFLLLYIACLCFTVYSQAQTSVPISTTISDGQGAAIPGSFLRFELWNCGPNFPTVVSTGAVLVKQTFDLTPNSTGAITGSVIANDAIVCGGVVSTRWNVTPMKDSATPLNSTQRFNICSALAPVSMQCGNTPGQPFNPALAQPDTDPPPAPGYTSIFSNPIKNQTLVQPSNTSLKLFGNIDFTGATVIGFTATNTNATQIQNIPICGTAPSNGQVLTYVLVGNTWCPGASGTNANASQIQGVNVNATAPATGQYLGYNGTYWIPTTVTGFLALSGGTLTGPLTLQANAASALQPVALQQMTATLAGYATLVSGLVPLAQMGSGSDGSGTHCLLDNHSWATCPGGSGSSKWSGLLNPTANVALTQSTYTTAWTIGDFGSSPSTGVFATTDTASSSTDTSVNWLFNTGPSSRHTPLSVQMSGVQQLQIGWQPGPQGETVIGSAVAFTSINQSPFAKFVAMSITAAHTVQRLYQGSAAATGTMQEWNNATAGTGFYFFKACAGATGGDTGCGSGTIVSSLRGDGLFTSVSGSFTSLTASTATLTNATCSGTCTGFGSANAGTQYQGAYYATTSSTLSPDPNVISNATSWTSAHSGGIYSNNGLAPSFGGPCSAALVVPGAGNSKVSMDTDCDFYKSINGGAKAQVLDATGLTRGQRLFGTARGNGVNVTAGTEYEYTLLLAGATADARLQQCITDLASSGGICDMTGEASSITPASTITITTNNITVYWVSGTYSEPSNVTINISGNDDSVICFQKWTCVIDASNNGSAGAFNITGGQNNELAGFKVLGGRMTEQTGFEVNVTGSYQRIHDMWVANGGSFGIQLQNCFECIAERNRTPQATKAGIGVNAASTAVTSATRVTTTATITVAGGHAIGSSGTQTMVMMQSCSLTPYNGIFQATSTGATTFTYTMASDPGGTATACTYLIWTHGDIVRDNVIEDSNDIDSGDGQLAIQSAGGIGAVDGTVIEHNTLRNNVFAAASCNGDTTGATALGIATLTGNGTTITATVSAGVTAPNSLMLTSPTASQVIFTGISTGSLSNATLYTVASVGATTFTITNANCNTSCTGTITFVVAGHGSLSTGCSESIQQTDKATNTEISGNKVFSSYRESYASSGTGVRMHHNYCKDPALVSVGSGSGCYMLSVSSGGGLSIAGDATFDHNVAVNTGTNTSAYAFSIEAGSGASATVFQNINISDNVIDGSVSTFGAGVRYSNGSANTMTLKNINAHDDAMVGATAPLTLTYTNTTGTFSTSNNGTMVQGVPLSVALGTSIVNATTCNVVSGSPFTATGITTSSRLSWSYAATPSAVTGYSPNGATLNVVTYPTANAINVLLCNPTGGGITPSAMSIVVDARNQ